MKAAAFVLALLCCSAFAQGPKKRLDFCDFPVKDIYKGKPAPPRLVTRDQREFRTMIRQGAQSKVEFAGHYTVPQWGCGTACVDFVIVDSISGEIYDKPFRPSELPLDWERQQTHVPEVFEFHPDSRLFKINGCPNDADCGFYDFVMVEGKGLKLVRKELLPKQFQP